MKLGGDVMRWVLGGSFIAMAAWMLIPDKLDEGDGDKPLRLGVFGTTLVAFFLAEMGDKTQIATVMLAARYNVWLPVVMGTTLGMMLANVPVVWLGERITRLVPIRKEGQRIVANLAAAYRADPAFLPEPWRGGREQEQDIEIEALPEGRAELAGRLLLLIDKRPARCRCGRGEHRACGDPRHVLVDHDVSRGVRPAQVELRRRAREPAGEHEPGGERDHHQERRGHHGDGCDPPRAHHVRALGGGIAVRRERHGEVRRLQRVPVRRRCRRSATAPRSGRNPPPRAPRWATGARGWPRRHGEAMTPG